MLHLMGELGSGGKGRVSCVLGGEGVEGAVMQLEVCAPALLSLGWGQSQGEWWGLAGC